MGYPNHEAGFCDGAALSRSSAQLSSAHTSDAVSVPASLPTNHQPIDFTPLTARSFRASEPHHWALHGHVSSISIHRGGGALRHVVATPVRRGTTRKSETPPAVKHQCLHVRKWLWLGGYGGSHRRNLAGPWARHTRAPVLRQNGSMMVAQILQRQPQTDCKPTWPGIQLPARSVTLNTLDGMARASGHRFGLLDKLYMAVAWGYGHGACHAVFFFLSLLPLTTGEHAREDGWRVGGGTGLGVLCPRPTK